MAAPSAVRARFWLEIAILGVSVALWLATLIWPDWIELAFHVDPDEGDGSLERIVSLALPALGLVVALVAGMEWRRPRLRMTLPRTSGR
jgi:hypothetical protein